MAHTHCPNMPQPLEAHKLKHECKMPFMSQNLPHTVFFVPSWLGCWSYLPSFLPGALGPSLGWFPGCALLSLVPGAPGLLCPAPVLCRVDVGMLHVGGELCSPFSSGSPGYGSQPGGELPFAKLDNRPGSLSEDWRCGSTCYSWHRARSILPSSGKGRPGCSRSWQVAELGVDGRARAGAAHWLPQAPTPPASLVCCSPWPAPASPAASKLPEQAPPAGPCLAVTGSEWPLPWTCLRSSSPCWSTLCLGQRRGQVGAQEVCTGRLPRCPRDGVRLRDSGRTD